MKHTPTPFLTRCLSGALAVLIPLQVTLSCAPLGRAQESLSRVQGNKTDLMFDTQKPDPSTDTSPSEGWADKSQGEGGQGEGEKIEGVIYVLVAPEEDDLNVKVSPPERIGEPPQLEITLKAPSNPDKKDDSRRPSFPLNPGMLKTKPELQKDVQKRLVEREKTAQERQGALGKQVAESEAKQKQAPPEALGKALGAAEGEHGQAAGDIKSSLEKTVADATSGSDTPPGSTPVTDTSPGLPPNGIPGKRGEKLARTRERAGLEAAAEKNPFSADLAKAAKGLLDDAEKQAREGNPTKADEKEKQAERLINIAGIPPERMPPRRPKNEKPAGPDAPINERRGEALGVGLDLYEAAKGLSESGFSGLSEKTRRAAAIAIDVGIGVARFGALLDLPLSVMEAFGGLTLEANANGGIGFRTATKLEMAFGFAAIACAGLAFAAGGWTAVAGVSVIGITKGALKGLERRLGAGAAKKVVEEAAAKAPRVVEKLDGEGVKILEEALREQGRKPEKIKEAIESFLEGSIAKEVAEKDVIVYRYHDDGVNASAIGSYVTPELFSDVDAARKSLALPHKWNGMTKLETLVIPKDTTFFSGIVAPQDGFPGGAIQYFLPDFGKSLKRLP